MTLLRIKNLAVLAGISAVAGMAASAIYLSSEAVVIGSPPVSGSNVTALIRGRVTTSTTAFSVAPQIHATENGKCVKSSSTC